ncbi:MAG TPA: hypothetical protein VK921_03620, partial [Anditalea sp.]|nr:hypothetical protein [Anditalea sp.]
MKFVNIRMWLFLFGAIFLIAAYLFQKSQTNKKQLHHQAMKSIELTRINFQQAFDGYHQQLEGYLNRLFFSMSDLDKDSAAKKISKLVDRPGRFPIQQITLLKDKDSIYAFQKHRTLNVVSFDSSFIFEKDYLFSFDHKPSEDAETPYRPEVLLKSLLKQTNWKYQGDSNSGESNHYFGITHPISFYDLMKHNLNNKFFDEIYVLDQGGLVLYPQYQKGMRLFLPDDLYADSSDPEGNRLMKLGNKNIRLQINSEDHEVFIAPVALGEEYLYLAGVKELGQFQKVALRIDYNLLSAFVIALLIIFTSIPIFSMLNMDIGDVLSRNKVYVLGLSLIVFSLIIGFTVAFIRNQYIDEDHDEVLEHIEESYQSTISFFVQHLDHHTDCKYSPCPDRMLYEGYSPLHKNINEYLELNEKYQISRMNFFRDSL